MVSSQARRVASARTVRSVMVVLPCRIIFNGCRRVLEGFPLRENAPCIARRFAPTISAACCARRRCGRLIAPSTIGELDEAGFVAAQDAAIRDAIALQADAGLAVVTDGEFRRASYWSRFVERTEGLSVSESRFTFRDEQGMSLPSPRRW